MAEAWSSLRLSTDDIATSMGSRPEHVQTAFQHSEKGDCDSIGSERATCGDRLHEGDGSDSDSDDNARPKIASLEIIDTKPLPPLNFVGRLSKFTARATHGAFRWRRTRWPTWMLLGGWRQTVRSGAAVAITVLLANIAILVLGWLKPVNEFTQQRLLASGDCATVQRTSTSWHFIINVLSTLLLATSNTAMQCLTAPTREAVDRAHADGTWLDIGISSLRNWHYIERWRKWCWILLALSTMPLHLLYNSVIFTTTSATDYWVLAVTPDFINGASFVIPDQTAFQSELDPLYIPSTAFVSNLSSLASKMTHLDNEECINTYSQPLVNTYSNVLAVAKPNNISSSSSLLRYYPYFPFLSTSNTWICGYDLSECNLGDLLGNASKWNLTQLYSYEVDGSSLNTTTEQPFTAWAAPIDVDYCLAQPVQLSCTLQLIPEIMLVVIIANLVKIACFLSILKTTSLKPLVTLGDALASFITLPDHHSRKLGPLSAAQIRQAAERARKREMSRIICARESRRRAYRALGSTTSDDACCQNTGEPTSAAERIDPFPNLPLELGPWQERRQRWFSGASRLRWVLTYLLTVALFSVAAAFLPFASPLGSWSSGFGNITPDSLIRGSETLSLVRNSIIANLPQIGLSLIYLSLNGLLTCILLSREFTLFANRREGLRVTEPKGRYQKSTYWLSLPYAYSLPLLGISWALHWAVSQSLFLAEIQTTLPNGDRDIPGSVSALGASSPALTIVVILDFILCVAPLVLGFRRFQGNAPLVASNSLAISAACHPLSGMSDEASQLLKYGAVEVMYDDEQYHPQARTGSIDTGRQSMPEQAYQKTARDAAAPLLPDQYAFPATSVLTTHVMVTPSDDASLTQPSPMFLPTDPNHSLHPSHSSCSSLHQTLLKDAHADDRVLIATLSSQPVAALQASHTYTILPSLDSTSMTDMRKTSLPHPKAYKWLQSLLTMMVPARATAIVILLVSFLTQLRNLYWGSHPSQVQPDLLFAVLVSFAKVFYLTVRCMERLTWLRKRTAPLRKWWWHVAPEIGLGLLWFPIISADNIPMDRLRIAVNLYGIECFFAITYSVAEFWFWSRENPGTASAVVDDIRHKRWKLPGRLRI